SAAAMPLPVLRKSRRFRPRRLAARSLRSLSRSSNAFCCGVCGGGMNSSLEAMRVGIGDRASLTASSSHWRTHIVGLLKKDERGDAPLWRWLVLALPRSGGAGFNDAHVRDDARAPARPARR